MDFSDISSVHKGKKEQELSFKYRLVKHIESVHERKNSNVIFVTKSFSLHSDFKKHVACVHEGIKPFKCRVCDSKFSLKSSRKESQFNIL